VNQVLHRVGFQQPMHQHGVDECFVFLRGELQAGEHRLTPDRSTSSEEQPYGPFNRGPEHAGSTCASCSRTRPPPASASPWRRCLSRGQRLTKDGLPQLAAL